MIKNRELLVNLRSDSLKKKNQKTCDGGYQNVLSRTFFLNTNTHTCLTFCWPSWDKTEYLFYWWLRNQRTLKQQWKHLVQLVLSHSVQFCHCEKRQAVTSWTWRPLSAFSKQGLLIPVSRLKTPVGKQDNCSVESNREPRINHTCIMPC